MKQRDNNLTDTLSLLNGRTADTQAIAGKVLFFASAHFLFFNYGLRSFGTFALACKRTKPTEARSKEPNFARALLNPIVAIIIFCTSIIISCSEITRTTNKSGTGQELSLNPVYNISATTRMFLDEMKRELQESKQSLQSYNPSQNLTDKFSMNKDGNSYFISGFIKVSDTFDKTTLEKLGVRFGQPSGNVITVSVPLQNLADFLNNTDIEYFEVSQKVFQK